MAIMIGVTVVMMLVMPKMMDNIGDLPILALSASNGFCCPRLIA